MTEVERRYVAWCAELRLRGVHPEWFAVWMGANKIDELFLASVTQEGAAWPLDAHFHKPKPGGNTVAGAYERGLPMWNALKEKARANED